MPPIVLHHFDASPFAEKIRLILGFRGANALDQRAHAGRAGAGIRKPVAPRRRRGAPWPAPALGRKISA